LHASHDAAIGADAFSQQPEPQHEAQPPSLQPAQFPQPLRQQASCAFPQHDIAAGAGAVASLRGAAKNDEPMPRANRPGRMILNMNDFSL
jgi:hypothetical protein